ncbi:MAG TPA: nucleotidyl transferase AbiEii/AbiGii toxin family protein, partial [Saprospiraceae bacterium]|nr:nucleotidyl transferase AbiEii/AbiGii toxin family protein [Saprospiraceae bacterium]
MITRKELIQKAKLIGIPPSTVDKDYVLGHFLNALFSYEWAQSNLVFKGGTSLSKAWKLINRFSEDIDLAIDRDFFEGYDGDLSRKQITKL